MSNKEILDEIEKSWMSEGHLVKIDREHFDWLIKQAEKVERYEKALKTIAEHQYYGSIGAIGYYAEFKSIAKQALEGSE